LYLSILLCLRPLLLRFCRRMEMLTQPGALLHPTVDCFTRPGSVQLVNQSRDQLQHDYQTIRNLEKGGLFQLL
jgi:hypothetical protein